MGESSRVFIPVDFVEQYQSPSAHGLITTYFAVALVESLPTDLPLTPNLRRPNRRTEIFKQILNTLLVAPERFAERNNGIKITARGVEIGELDSQKGIWVDLGDDRATGGVVNGGHTLAAIAAAKIEGAPLEAARVKVEILCGLGDVEVGVTSLAVNTAAPVDTRSKLNALGRFEPLKALVKQIEAETGERWKVSWYQNQEGVNKSPHCSATHANDLLLVLDRIRFDFTSPGRKAHPNGTTSSAKFSSEAFFERQQQLLPRLEDAFWLEKNLYKLVEKHLNHPSVRGGSNLAGVRPTGSICLLDGTYFGFTTPVSFSLPVVAAYRAFLEEEAPCNRWAVPIDEFGEPLLAELWKWYKQELRREKARGNNTFTPIIRNPILWSSLCVIATEMRRQIESTPTTPVGDAAVSNRSSDSSGRSHDSSGREQLESVRLNHTASELHLGRLSRGVKGWNSWREKHPEIIPNLVGAVLSGTNLSAANLSQANLFEAYLNKTNLRGANLSQTNLAGANLVEADLVEANLVGANLARTIALGTNFNGATLTGACLEDCQLDRETNLDNVICDYVYLKKNQLERRPETGNFTPGEFAKLFQFQ